MVLLPCSELSQLCWSKALRIPPSSRVSSGRKCARKKLFFQPPAEEPPPTSRDNAPCFSEKRSSMQSPCKLNTRGGNYKNLRRVVEGLFKNMVTKVGGKNCTVWTLSNPKLNMTLWVYKDPRMSAEHSLPLRRFITANGLLHRHTCPPEKGHMGLPR